jgi:hypothetical protein
MIRDEPLTTTVRFYENDDAEVFDDYDAVCTLFWESHHIVWIKGLHGTLSLKLMKQLVSYLYKKGVTHIKAYRAHTRNLPFTSNRVGNLVEIDVANIIKRWPNIVT